MLLPRELMRRRRERRLQAKPLLHFVPNMFTILGLCLGLTGLRYGLDGRFEFATGLVLLAAVTDGLDGRSARLLKATSRLGAELDSLADFVNFGVVPALLVYLWVLEEIRGLGWAIAILFATCSALRLARFNSELDHQDKPRWTAHFFKGIPAPAAAMCALLPMMLAFGFESEWSRHWMLNAVILTGTAFMMVSTVPSFSGKRVRVRNEQVRYVLLLLGLCIVLLVSEPWLTLSSLVILYIASIPVAVVIASRMRRDEEREGLRADDASDDGPLDTR